MRRGIILKEANPVSGVFQNIDPPAPTPLTARRVCTPPPTIGAEGGHTRWAERGWGVNSLEGARVTALYSIYVSTLRLYVSILGQNVKIDLAYDPRKNILDGTYH
jgi:hypothetical protein